jgi:hypothetical protein
MNGWAVTREESYQVCGQRALAGAVIWMAARDKCREFLTGSGMYNEVARFWFSYIHRPPFTDEECDKVLAAIETDKRLGNGAARRQSSSQSRSSRRSSEQIEKRNEVKRQKRAKLAALKRQIAALEKALA